MLRASILATAALVVLPAGASAATVRATVAVKNTTAAVLSPWSMKVTLAKGTRLKSVAGGVTALQRTGTIGLRGSQPLKPGATKKLTVVIRGAKAPSKWAFQSKACTASNAARRGSTRAVRVSCTVPPGTANNAWVKFAPYADMAGYPPPDLAAARTNGAIRGVTLGFVTARDGTACEPTWGGYPTYPASGASAHQLASVRGMRAAGGEVVVSFGGQAGTDLATACPTPEALAAAYTAVVDAYKADRVDFDVEGTTAADGAANARRAQAIGILQRSRPVSVAFTLPVLPTGLDANGIGVLRAALTQGVRPALVNVMAMDYGDSAAPNPSGRMGSYAISAATYTAKQLQSLVPGLSPTAALGAIGVTPMLGVNDVESETFTLDDARKLVAWAQQQHIGALSMWSLGRDRPCASPMTSAQPDCSSIGEPAWAFSRAFGAFTG